MCTSKYTEVHLPSSVVMRLGHLWEAGWPPPPPLLLLLLHVEMFCAAEEQYFALQPIVPPKAF
jgi:hypothetical protein